MQQLWPEGRASGLARLHEPPEGLPGSGAQCTYFLHSPSGSSGSLVSSRMELMPFARRPNCCSCCQGTPLHHLALVAGGTDAHRSYGTVTNGEGVLKPRPPLGHSKRQQAWELSLSKPVSLSLVQLLGQASNETHTQGLIGNFPETLAGRRYFHPLLLCLTAPALSEGNLGTRPTPQF